MYVFHTVNAGIYLQEGDYGLLIDALHGGEGGFSRTPNEIMKHISRHTDSLATKIDLAFTHLHGDHFNMERVSDFMDKYPSAEIYAPEMWKSCIYTYESSKRIRDADLGRFHLIAFPTVHDGKEYTRVPHQSLMLRTSDQQQFICGDAALDISLARDIQKNCPGTIKAVFVNLFQLASKDGQAFLKEIRPQHIFLYHLPFLKDDVYAYRKIAEGIIEKLPQELNYIQVLEAMQPVF